MSLQTIKGLNFVATTGVLYYLVLRRSFHRQIQAAAIKKLNLWITRREASHVAA